MAQQNIILGTPNNEDGDFVRDAFVKTEDNFTELYARTNTSNFVNDGSDGTSTFVETDELGTVAFSNDYGDLDNLPDLTGFVTLSGAQTILSTKTFNTGGGGTNAINITNSSSGRGIDITNSASGRGVNIANSSTGRGLSISNSNALGYGIYSNNSAGTSIYANPSSSGVGIQIDASGSGFPFRLTTSGSADAISAVLTGSSKGLVINGQAGSTGANAIEVQDNTFTRFTVTKEGIVSASGMGSFQTLRTTTGYTVATLPSGTVGMRAYVTDADSPTYLGALTGGGAVVCPVFYDGTAWISA